MIKSKRAQEAEAPKKVEVVNRDADGWAGIMDALDDLDDVLKKTTTQVDVDDIFDAWSPMTFAQPIYLYPVGHEFWKYDELEMLSTRAKLKAIGISPSILDAVPNETCYDMIAALNEMRDDFIEFYGPYNETD